MSDKHISSQFDAELRDVSTRVLEMGGLAEAQVAQAIYALSHFSGETASQVLRQEERLNQMEVEIDADLQRIIAMRQPTAVDLRLLIAISKTTGNLERVGDEAARIARTVQRLIGAGVSTRMRLPVADLAYEAELAVAQLRKSLDAFARLDATQALDVLNDREKDILTQRRLSDTTVTLEDLSGQYNVSRERIRQIEVRAFEKLQRKMRDLAREKGMLASA